MRYKHFFICICLLVVILTGCKKNIDTVTKDVGTTEIPNNNNQAQNDSEKKTINIVKRVVPQKKYLTVNGIEIKRLKYDPKDISQNVDAKTELEYLQINGLTNKKTQDKINSEIKVEFANAIREVVEDKNNKIYYISCYDEASYNNVLSIGGYIYYMHNEVPSSYYKTLVFNLKDGERLKLKDVFTKGTDYIGLLNQEVKEYILKENLEEDILSQPFESISENTQFGVMRDTLKLYFNKGDNKAFADDLCIFIPFKALQESYYIFDRYAESPVNLYVNKTKMEVLSADFDVIYKQKFEENDIYRIDAQYIQLKNMHNKILEEKVNTRINQMVEGFFKEQTKAKNNTSEKLWSSINVNLEGNCFGKIGIVITRYSPDSSDLSTVCCDINSGKEVGLSEFLKDNPKYKERVLQVVKEDLLNKNKNADIFDSFEILEGNVSYTFNNYALFLYPKTKNDLIKSNELNDIFIYIPFEKIEENLTNLL